MPQNSGELDELGPDQHGATINLAVDGVIAVDQVDALDLGASLESTGLAVDLQVLDERDIVTLVELFAIGIEHDDLA